MQVDTTTVAVVGTVAQDDLRRGRARQRLGADPDRSRGRRQVGRQPGRPGRGGPQGIFTGCDVDRGRKYYGHGYGVAVAPGKAEFGLATNWHNDGFGWTGFGAPGDSGSPVLTATGQAAGNFTHLIVDTGDYPGSDHAGTRITKALSQFGVSLVNADGSTTGAAGTSCG